MEGIWKARAGFVARLIDKIINPETGILFALFPDFGKVTTIINGKVVGAERFGKAIK